MLHCTNGRLAMIIDFPAGFPRKNRKENKEK
jgi:hypothetical protein